jgi:hypothetical protein
LTPDYFLRRFYYDTALSASPHCFASLLTVTDTSHILSDELHWRQAFVEELGALGPEMGLSRATTRITAWMSVCD